MENYQFENKNLMINSLKKQVKYLICAVSLLSVIIFGIIGIIIYQQLEIGLITIDTFVGAGVALIGVLATIILANHFISIFNFNNKINEIEKEVEIIRVLKKNMVRTQFENNNNLAHNTFLEGKKLKAVIIELNNMHYLLKSRSYFDEEDKEFKKRLEAKIGYIANDFACFIEEKRYECPTFCIEDAILELQTSYNQLLNIDTHSIKVKLEKVYNIIIHVLNNIVEHKYPIIEKQEFELLEHMRKR